MTSSAKIGPPMATRPSRPNPIDTQGHGSHVADIAAGRSADRSHLGIAPAPGCTR